MSRKKYLRVYCNNQKVRSTGHEKHVREEMLKDFGCYDPNTVNNMKFIRQHIPTGMLQNETLFRFKIEIVQSTPTGKYIIDILHPRYYILKKDEKLFFQYDNQKDFDAYLEKILSERILDLKEEL